MPQGQIPCDKARRGFEVLFQALLFCFIKNMPVMVNGDCSWDPSRPPSRASKAPEDPGGWQCGGPEGKEKVLGRKTPTAM